jgi:phosphoglycolate phosphatase-like HAD superfamily hydrolase
MEAELASRLRQARLVCWDFDGVIKDSVSAKTVAFHELFLPYGADVADKVRDHHLDHGGMSRFDKMPIYLGWADLEPSAARVGEFCDRFAEGVREAVVRSPWVPGAQSLLLADRGDQEFVLVTATPQEEIEGILGRLGIRECFGRVFGAPTPKATAIRTAMTQFGIGPEGVLMIGDSRQDYRAAQECGVAFVLRRTVDNARAMADYNGPLFTTFE